MSQIRTQNGWSPVGILCFWIALLPVNKPKLPSDIVDITHENG